MTQSLTDEPRASLRSIEAISADLAKEAHAWAQRIEGQEFWFLTPDQRCDLRAATMVMQRAADDLRDYLQERAEDRAMTKRDGSVRRIGRGN
jgi:hypothetical protein